MRHVDYLAIDTEGSEPQILEGFVFSRYVIDILQVRQFADQPQTFIGPIPGW